MIGEVPPLSLYLHIPWCVKKCPYCDFNSHAGVVDAALVDNYVTALQRDLDFSMTQLAGRELGSVFIGGGTPSLFPASAIASLLADIKARFVTRPDVEVTLEANPGTVETGRFEAYAAAGVNRLSLGVQSFSDRSLAALGRIHSAGEARHAIELAQQAGFDSINIDLMYALPGQDLAAAMEDLEQACAQVTGHLSWYQLTIEPNTVFYSQPPVLPDVDSSWAMASEGARRLSGAGYQQYEVSAWARPGQRCRHNRNYWLFGDYLGLGAGAHSKITSVSGIERVARHRSPASYMAHAGSASSLVQHRRLSREELALEFMMNALRLKEGFSPELFRQRCGYPIEDLQEAMDRASDRGLLDYDRQWVQATELGYRYLDDLVAEFM